LAQAYTVKASIMDNRNSAEGPTTEQLAVDILQPLSGAPHASVAVRRAYLETLIRVGYEQATSNRPDACITTARQGMQLAEDLGARDLKDVDAAANYAEAGAWYLTCLTQLGRDAEAVKVGEDVLAVSDQVLAQRPGYRSALHAAQVATGGLYLVAQNALNPAEQLRLGRRDAQTSAVILALEPHNVTNLNNMGVSQEAIGASLWALGRLSESIPYFRKGLETLGAATAGGSSFAVIHASNTLSLAISLAMLGDSAAATATLAAEKPYVAKVLATEAPGTFSPVLMESSVKIGSAVVAFLLDDPDKAREIAADGVKQLRATKTTGSFQANQLAIVSYNGLHVMGRVDYLHGDYAAAEREERESRADRQQWSTQRTADQRDLAEVSTWLAMSLARQGKLADALREIAPVVTLERELSARNHGDVWQPTELAAALYAQALSDPPRRAALLKEAAALLDAAAPSLKPLREIRRWRQRVSQAQQG
jgi:tetratricopeptide (TPR) repeat protein